MEALMSGKCSKCKKPVVGGHNASTCGRSDQHGAPTASNPLGFSGPPSFDALPDVLFVEDFEPYPGYEDWDLAEETGVPMTFEELSEEAKLNAVESFRDSELAKEMTHDDALSDAAYNIAEKLGVDHEGRYKTVETSVDLSFSQGSGASLTGTIYRDEMNEEKIPWPDGVSAAFIRRRSDMGHYVHSNTMMVEVEYEGDYEPWGEKEKEEDEVYDDQENLLEHFQGVCDKAHRDAENTALTSWKTEEIIDYLSTNNVDLKSNGDLW
jgi:hypothetical protein